jgi:hypothetical protein
MAESLTPAVALALLAGACASPETNSSSPSGSSATSAPSGDEAARAEATAAVRALAEKCDGMKEFSARYQMQIPERSAAELRLHYKAPNFARLDVTNAEGTIVTRILSGFLDMRAVDQGNEVFAEFPLKEFEELKDAFLAVLAKEFPEAVDAEKRDPGPVFLLDLLPPQSAEDDGHFHAELSWMSDRSHLLQWLNEGIAANAWRAEGGEFVRSVPGGGAIRVSQESGFVTSITHPAGVDVRLVALELECDPTVMHLTRPEQGVKDVTEVFRAGFVASASDAMREETYSAALTAWPADAVHRADFDARVTRVFAEIHHSTAHSLDAVVAASAAPKIAEFVEWCRSESARAAGTPSHEPAFDAAFDTRRNEFKKQLLASGQQHAAHFQIPRLDPAALPPDSFDVRRLGPLLALERAAFLADYRELVVTPALARLDAALKSAGLAR